MKYLKTNEGLFSKDEIPKNLIDDIEKEIEKNYSVTVSGIKTADIVHSVTFKTKTPIGDVDLVLNLEKPYNKGKLRSAIIGNNIIFEFFQDGKRRFDWNYELKQLRGDQLSVVLVNITKSIDHIVNRVTRDRDRKTEHESFYNIISVDEIKDLCGDLYDLIGEFTVEKAGREYLVKFSNVTGIVATTVNNNARNITSSIRPNDRMLKLLIELNSLYKRLLNGYKLTMLFSIVPNNFPVSKSLVITISKAK